MIQGGIPQYSQKSKSEGSQKDRRFFWAERWWRTPCSNTDSSKHQETHVSPLWVQRRRI